MSKAGLPKVRQMNVGSYDDCPWIHWDHLCGKLFCFYCLSARQRNQLLFILNDEPTFVQSGFCDWKNAIRAFRKHSHSRCHQEAVAAWNRLRIPSVEAQLQSQIARDHESASRALNVIVDSLRYLAQSPLSFSRDRQISIR